MTFRKFLKRAITVFVVSLLLVVGISAIAAEGFMSRFFGKYNNLADVTEALDNMSSAQLVQSVAEAAREAELNFNEQNFMYFSTAMLERADEFTDEDLTDIASNENYSGLMRVLAIQILGQIHNYEFDSDDLCDLLKADNISDEIRTNIMVACNFSSKTGKELLITLANDNNPETVFQAMKQLRSVDLDAACEIADNIISNYELYHEKIVCAAILAKSKALSIENYNARATENDIAQFIQFCSDFHDEATDQVSQDTAIIGIKRLHRPEGIEAIVQNKKFDPIMQSGAIGENSVVLYQMIEEDPSEANIELVCHAMEICPISVFEVPLTKIREDINTHTAYSSRLNESLDLIDHALSRIKEDGIYDRRLVSYCEERNK